MSDVLIEDKEFRGVDFTSDHPKRGTYESCRFINCHFSNSTLSHIIFVDCVFETCDLSNARVANTAFRNITFKNCKLLGVHFEHCKPFLLQVRFESCQLDLSVFYKLSLKNTVWLNCSMKETDFAEADLTGSTFSDCDLSGAVFARTKLEKADLRSAFNYSIDPESNSIAKARFSLPGLPGLLHKYKIDVE